jgi:hypothetical protein
MDQQTMEALVTALAPVIKEFVADQLGQLQAALEASQARLAVVEAGLTGQLAPVLVRLEAAEGALARLASDCRTYVDSEALGIRNDLAAVEASVEALARRAAEPGPPGDPGRDGADGATPGQILEMVQDAVGVAVAALPKAVDGTPGAPGADGVGLAGALVDSDGHLVVTLTNGTVKQLCRVVGADGKDGAPGRDGFGFEDLTVEHDGGRKFIFTFTRGTETKQFEFSMPAMIYRGIWDPRELGYSKGDVVTKQGSGWVALEDPAPGDEPGAVVPGVTSSWQLAVKRGQNGKDGQLKPPPTSTPVKVGG